MKLVTEIAIKSRLSEGHRLRKLISQKTAHLDISPGVLFDLQLAVSEAFNNATEHGFASVSANQVIVRLYHSTSFISIEIEDSGCGVPLKHIQQKRPVVFGERERGMGLSLMKILMDEVKISSRSSGGTLVTFIKYLN